MIVLYSSCRDDFSNVFIPGKCNLYHDADGDDMAEPQFVERIAGKTVLILEHGYRSETGDGPYYTKVLTGMRQWGIADHYGAVVGHLWPGGELAADYPIASGCRAGESAPHLADLTCLLMAHGCTVDVQTHSLGAHVAMDALHSHAAWWRHLFMLAPAVDDKALQSDHPFGQAVEKQVTSATVFFSRRDDVLNKAFPLGEAACGHFRSRALGYHGLADPTKKPANVAMIDCTEFIGEHSEYRISQQFHAEWQKCFGLGE